MIIVQLEEEGGNERGINGSGSGKWIENGIFEIYETGRGKLVCGNGREGTAVRMVVRVERMGMQAEVEGRVREVLRGDFWGREVVVDSIALCD